MSFGNLLDSLEKKINKNENFDSDYFKFEIKSLEKKVTKKQN